MKNFIEAAQYAFAALGGALGAVMGGFDGFTEISNLSNCHQTQCLSVLERVLYF